MLGFLHYRLLPYLSDEDCCPTSVTRSGSRHRRDFVTATCCSYCSATTIGCVRTSTISSPAAPAASSPSPPTRSSTGLTGTSAAKKRGSARPKPPRPDVEGWALPLLLDNQVELDALPAEHRLTLLRYRLGWLRPGETVHLDSRSDPHPLGQQLHALDHNAYHWVYDEDGPARWRARITRPSAEEC